MSGVQGGKCLQGASQCSCSLLRPPCPCLPPAGGPLSLGVGHRFSGVPETSDACDLAFTRGLTNLRRFSRLSAAAGFCTRAPGRGRMAEGAPRDSHALCRTVPCPLLKDQLVSAPNSSCRPSARGKQGCLFSTETSVHGDFCSSPALTALKTCDSGAHRIAFMVRAGTTGSYDFRGRRNNPRPGSVTYKYALC